MRKMVFFISEMSGLPGPAEVAQRCYVTGWSRNAGLRTTLLRGEAAQFNVNKDEDMHRANTFQAIISTCFDDGPLQFEIFNSFEDET